MSALFEPAVVGPMTLQNRVVMAPLTRNRASGNLPNDLMKRYYGQRATVGLVISEGTSPSPNGLGYPRIPGVFAPAQVALWKPVSAAVHAQGAKMFLQIMHCGRIAHGSNLPPGARVLGPSAVAASGDIFTDGAGLQPMAKPQAMSEADITNVIAEYVQAAHNAVAAGFDGIELHAANGYLLEQYIRPNSNVRTDRYGGPIANRARFVLEVVEAVIHAIGRDRVGMRLSPFGVFNDMPLYAEMDADYRYLAQQLDTRGLLYLHLVDHSAMGAPPVPASIKAAFRSLFTGALILSGGYDKVRAEADLAAGRCDLVAIGRPMLANPDLLRRWKTGAGLNLPDMSTFYTPGAKGYTDYPTLEPAPSASAAGAQMAGSAA